MGCFLVLKHHLLATVYIPCQPLHIQASPCYWWSQSVLGTRRAQIDSQALRNQIRQRWRKNNVFLVASLFQVGFSSLEAQASGFIFSLLRMGENKESKQALRGLCRALGLTFSSLEHSSLKAIFASQEEGGLCFQSPSGYINRKLPTILSTPSVYATYLLPKDGVFEGSFNFVFLSAANLKVAGACAHGKIAPSYLKGL